MIGRRQFDLCQYQRKVRKLVNFPDQAASCNSMAFFAKPAAEGCGPLLIKRCGGDLGFTLLADETRAGFVIEMELFACVWKDRFTNTPIWSATIAKEISLIQLPNHMALGKMRQSPQQPYAFNFLPNFQIDFPAGLIKDFLDKLDHCATKSARTSF